MPRSASGLRARSRTRTPTPTIIRTDGKKDHVLRGLYSYKAAWAEGAVTHLIEYPQPAGIQVTPSERLDLVNGSGFFCCWFNEQVLPCRRRQKRVPPLEPRRRWIFPVGAGLGLALALIVGTMLDGELQGVALLSLRAVFDPRRRPRRPGCLDALRQPRRHGRGHGPQMAPADLPRRAGPRRGPADRAVYALPVPVQLCRWHSKNHVSHGGLSRSNGSAIARPTIPAASRRWA